jgi:class 3 adenylate cyclase
LHVTQRNTCVALHPERATRLIVFGGQARFMWAPDYPWGWPEAELERRIDEVVHTRLTGENDVQFAGLPTVGGDREFQDWFLRARRRGLSPASCRAAFNAMWRSDLRPILPAITMPTLVLYRRFERLKYEEHARYIADHIRGSRLIELPGADGLPFVGEVDAVIDEVREFVTGVRSDRVPDRVLATVLFSDIVDSTAQATALGDRLWGQRLDAHDAMVRRELHRFRGREIRTTGDGFLATFDGPARAIHCGCAIRDGATHLGIEVRVGLHAGEVELRGEDIGGIAVHLAARVQTCARPGDVYVSRTVVDLVAGSGIVFDDRGEHELKGISHPWQLFAVDASGDGTTAP